MTAVMDAMTLYDQNYQALLQRWGSTEKPWLKTFRADAFSRFKFLGWPTGKWEDWRFTSLKKLVSQEFQAPIDVRERLDLKSLEPFLDAAHRPHLLVFENGRFRADLSRLDRLPAGVRLLPLRRALVEVDETLQDHLGRYADFQNEPLTALNSAFFEDGMVLLIGEGVKLEQPVQIINAALPGERPSWTHPRNLVILGEHAQADLVEIHFAAAEGCYFTNSVTEVLLQPSARLQHYFKEHQSERAFHVNTLKVRQMENSHFESHHLLIGGALVRNNISVELAGSGAEAFLNGLYVGHEDQQLDHFICIDHQQPHCRSTQYFKGMMDDRSHGVFCGRVIVREDAQKTDANQTNRNLLLAETARVDTMPQLEIYADDVKCAHGATTGQIDREALFYLTSRGLDPKAAFDLLLFAFAHEVVERMPLAGMRKQAESFLFKRFSKATLIEEDPR